MSAKQPKPLRDHYIVRHAANPAQVEKEINSFPSLGRSGATIEPPAAAKDGQLALNAEQSQVATMLGIDPKDYAETLKAEQDAGETPLTNNRCWASQIHSGRARSGGM